jgi:hypothetical protein
VTDYLAAHLNTALGSPASRIPAITEILDRLPLSYFDTEERIYESGLNWWFPTTRCLEVILLDSGFQNVTCELKLNAFYNYSHRRLMGRAEVDPAKSDPRNQQYEHWVAEQDFPVMDRLNTSTEAARRVPAQWLQRALRRLR